jgi:hypothetical protein
MNCNPSFNGQIKVPPTEVPSVKRSVLEPIKSSNKIEAELLEKRCDAFTKDPNQAIPVLKHSPYWGGQNPFEDSVGAEK